ncbi:MAG: hypothetical protein F6K16_25900 [Symploca sp. SIO2B6]|nr:hypothetical protein [Symploca sp. SIO2B6]
MAFNRCCLTREGKNSIVEALERLGIDPNNMSALEHRMAIDGSKIHRTTLNKMLGFQSECVQYGKIETLVNWINNQLQRNNLEELVLPNPYYKEVTTTKTTKRNGQKKVTQRLPVVTVPSSSIAASQQLTNLLWMLNCNTQEFNFEKSLKQLTRAGAFLVRGRSLGVQRWLTKRFAQKIPNFENATKLEFLLTRRQDIRADFEVFWTELGSKLGTPASQNSVLDRLCEFCQEKPVILTMYGFRRLDEQKINHLHQFWCQLVNKACTQKGHSLRARLILFLTDDGTKEISNVNCPFEFVDAADVGRPECPVLLTPLEQITPTDVENWLMADKVYCEFVNRIGKKQLEWLTQEDILGWSQDPWEVLDQICLSFELKKGIAEIETYWKLTG